MSLRQKEKERDKNDHDLCLQKLRFAFSFLITKSLRFVLLHPGPRKFRFRLVGPIHVEQLGWWT